MGTGLKETPERPKSVEVSGKTCQEIRESLMIPFNLSPIGTGYFAAVNLGIRALISGAYSTDT